MNWKTLIILVAFVLCLNIIIAAQVPAKFYYQGTLTDKNGSAIDGTRPMVASIWSAETGGSKRWEENLGSIAVKNGYFSVLLGERIAIPVSIFNSGQLYFEIQVAGEVMKPRQILASVPYAHVAGSVAGGGSTGDNLGDHIARRDIVLGSNKIKYKSSDTNTGLEIISNGGARVQNDLGHRGFLAGGDNAVAGYNTKNNTSGFLGTNLRGVEGFHSNGNNGRLGALEFGAWGKHYNGHRGSLGNAATGVEGFHSNGSLGVLGGVDYGVKGQRKQNIFGLLGTNYYGVFGKNDGGYAGRFEGHVKVTGKLEKGGGAFLIDHPLDPTNKYLSHSFVESPDMKNIYDGVVTLDYNGEAVVILPDWFGALNRNFRYQLTCIGGYANVYISKKLQNNSFSIAGGTPGLEVSWQLTGIRQDAWANANRIQVEVEKVGEEAGKYMHPAAFSQPASMGIGYDFSERLEQETQDIFERNQKISEEADGE